MEKKLTKGQIDVKISDNGQIVSLDFGGTEYWHGGGRTSEYRTKGDELGWPNSEIEMFPVVGPVLGGKVLVIGEDEFMGQHGIVRHLESKVLERYDYIPIVTSHSGKSFVKNLKYQPGMSGVSPVHSWPFKFSIVKSPSLAFGKLHVLHEVINEDRKKMPYMFGWHPAFRTQGEIKDGIISFGTKNITLEDVVKSDGNVVFVEDEKSIEYFDDNSGIGIRVETKDFGGNWMVWMPPEQSQMFCIEPVTHLPRDGVIDFDSQEYKSIEPGKREQFRTVITPF